MLRTVVLIQVLKQVILLISSFGNNYWIYRDVTIKADWLPVVRLNRKKCTAVFENLKIENIVFLRISRCDTTLCPSLVEDFFTVKFF
jgi:hypothetical protein